MINIFKRWFSHSKEQDVDDCQNPWAGLASYEDPETAERKLKFCGRGDESYDLARLIMGNVFVTLYGKSGIGKTSLLNAGVFPELREEQFTPTSIRLGMRDDDHPQSYQTMIIEAVRRVVKRAETINVIDEQQDQQSIDYLWNYFARHRYYDKYDELTTPVIVFDQFEEVFRGHRDEAETLLRQLDYLNDKDHTLDSCEVKGSSYRYEQNFRFVVSIREDDLYRLEDSIDNCYLPALKRCRYRLRSLSEEGARNAILIPGEGLFKPDEKDSIAETIIKKSRNDDSSISTNVISLLCSRIYVNFKKSGSDQISPSLVENFIKDNPFERFYNEAMQGFSNKEKSYIEDNLVDSTGRRNSIPESNLLLHVKNGLKLLEGKNRILQRISTSSDGKNNRIELIHDSFCEPLSNQKETRDKRKRMLWLTSVAGVALLSLGIVAFVFYQMYKVSEANRTMKENKARFVAEKASALVDEGDSYLARLLLLEVLPNDSIEYPYTIEAESALRKVMQHDNAILRGHTDLVSSAVFSPDGKRIVSASDDNTVRIWDAQTGKQIGNPLEGHTSIVSSAVFSPDGKRIVSASDDNTVRIWDAQTGKQIGNPLEGHLGLVRSAAFSPDGKRIVIVSDETIRIWDVQTGKQIGNPLVGHSGWVLSAVYSPDGKRIVSASRDKTIRIWDAQTGKQIGNPLEGHTVLVRSAVFSPDGKRIVSASDDQTVRIWDAQTGKQIGNPLVGHTDLVSSAAFSPDGKRIVSASRDKTIRIWDAQTGKQIGNPLEGHTVLVRSAVFSPDGKRIVSASDDNTVRIWDAQTGKQIDNPQERRTSIVNSAAFSPDGNRIVTASDDKTVRIWDVQTGKQIGNPLVGHTDLVRTAAFSPNGKRIVSASGDRTVRIWDVQTGKQIGNPLEGHTGPVRSAVFSPDGKRIVSASWDKTVRIWDVQTGKQICNPLVGHSGWVLSAVFSPNGKRIVSASGDRTVRIWDVQTGKQIGNPLIGHSGWVFSAVFSPDGKRIITASGDKTVRIWDAQTGKQIGNPLEGHTGPVRSAAFSPDGKRIVSVSDDNTVRIWDVQTGKQIGNPLEGHTGLVWSAAFSPDGKRIVSASSDNTILIFEFPLLQELIDKTRERFMNRQLTPEERRKYYLE